jgi:hypothetical protein
VNTKQFVVAWVGILAVGWLFWHPLPYGGFYIDWEKTHGTQAVIVVGTIVTCLWLKRAGSRTV